MKALHRLVQRVAATIERRSLFAPGQRIGVAVSGGADSVCLLYVLSELAAAWQFGLSVLHLDHQLRGDESRQDAEFVHDLANRLKLRVIARQATLGRGNLEEEGRRARLAFFRELIQSDTVERVATGHTRSDQAETVLFRLLRGAATAGLASIRPATADGLTRPLIDVDRSEVEAFLVERGIEWREDSTNSTDRFARNRIRHDLLPQLGREWNPEIAASLARMADWALAEEQYWEAELDRMESRLLRFQGNSVLLGVSDLQPLPVAVVRRLVRRAMERVKGSLSGIDFEHVNAVIRLALRADGRGRVEAPGVVVERSLGQLRMIVPFVVKEPTHYRTVVPIPGSATIPGEAGSTLLEVIENPYNGQMGCIARDRVCGPLELRLWQPGDRYRPFESVGDKKLKTMFHLARIPSWERRHWPVLVDRGVIVWTRQFGPAAAYAAGPGTQRILQIRESGPA